MVGTAGGEHGGIPGFIDAFDLEPGERRWRSYATGPGKLAWSSADAAASALDQV